MSCSYYTFRNNDYYCTKKGDYVNSDVYYKYCRNYDYSYCPIYKDEPVSGCYLTSACVEAKGLPDDCYELTTLRKFRDGWLREQTFGEADIQEYYATAPKIVSGIRALPDAAAVFEGMYQELVLPCVRMIEAGAMEKAYEHYKQFLLHLKKQYLVEE